MQLPPIVAEMSPGIMALLIAAAGWVFIKRVERYKRKLKSRDAEAADHPASDDSPPKGC